jgi:hypothetical protein
MKIFIVCSKKFYDKIPSIQKELESMGHTISLPNCYDDPTTEEKYRNRGKAEHSAWKASMIEHSLNVIKNNDAILVLNFEKNGIKNYVGGATFLEMYDAIRLGKKIFMYNDIPEGIMQDEIIGFNPMIIHGDLSQIV